MLRKLDGYNSWKRNSKEIVKISSASWQSDHFYYHVGMQTILLSLIIIPAHLLNNLIKQISVERKEKLDASKLYLSLSEVKVIYLNSKI